MIPPDFATFDSAVRHGQKKTADLNIMQLLRGVPPVGPPPAVLSELRPLTYPSCNINELSCVRFKTRSDSMTLHNGSTEKDLG